MSLLLPLAGGWFVELVLVWALAGWLGDDLVLAGALAGWLVDGVFLVFFSVVEALGLLPSWSVMVLVLQWGCSCGGCSLRLSGLHSLESLWTSEIPHMVFPFAVGALGSDFFLLFQPF